MWLSHCSPDVRIEPPLAPTSVLLDDPGPTQTLRTVEHTWPTWREKETTTGKIKE